MNQLVDVTESARWHGPPSKNLLSRRHRFWSKGNSNNRFFAFLFPFPFLQFRSSFFKKHLLLLTMAHPSGKRFFSPCLPPGKTSIDDHANSPLLNLPEELLFGITSFLDVRSLLTVRQLNGKFRDLASRNEAGWTALCHDLWKDKVHILDGACHSVNAMVAYRQSLQDARDRQYLTLDELCYDEATHSGTIWSFRFKEAAGPDWTRHDPWYNGLLARKMVFIRDGSVKQYIPTSAPEKSSPDGDDHILVTPNFGDDTRLTTSSERMEDDDEVPSHYHPRRQIPGGRQNHPPGVLVNPPLSMTWRFLNRPIDLPNRPTGSYIRLTVGGRDVPTYVVRRSPTGNWGFVLESLWGVYASFELPPRRQPNTVSLAPPSRRRHSPNTRVNTVRRVKKLRRSSSGQVVRVSADEDTSDDDEDDTRSNIDQDDANHESTRSDDVLLDDAEMVITNEVQWREAYLYNWGARVLPDGDVVGDDLDQVLAVMDG